MKYVVLVETCTLILASSCCHPKIPVSVINLSIDAIVLMYFAHVVLRVENWLYFNISNNSMLDIRSYESNFLSNYMVRGFSSNTGIYYFLYINTYVRVCICVRVCNIMFAYCMLVCMYVGLCSDLCIPLCGTV